MSNTIPDLYQYTDSLGREQTNAYDSYRLEIAVPGQTFWTEGMDRESAYVVWQGPLNQYIRCIQGREHRGNWADI